MECFRLLFDHLAWIEHQFFIGVRDSREPGSLWGMMRAVGGVRKSIHQSWLAKGFGLGLGLLCWGFKGVQGKIPWKRPALFKSAQWHFHQVNTPVHNSILVTDYLTKMGIKTVPQPSYSPDLAPCDFCLFPKLRGCRYETIEEMKEAVTKVIDLLTPENFHGPSRSFWNDHWSRRRLLRRGLEFHVFTINKSANTKKVWKPIVCTSYVLRRVMNS